MQTPVSVTYIVSFIDKSLGFEWVAEALNKEQFALSFILLNPKESTLERFLKQQQIPVFRVDYRGKKDALKAFFQIRKILKQLKTEVVHTQLVDASLVGLLAAKTLGIKKRISTRHHSNSHRIYYPRDKYYDTLINRLSTHIVAISQNVKNVLVEDEKVRPEKISIIHHGFRLELFENPDPKKVINLKKKYQTEGFYPVFGVISRYIHLKGIQYIIPAFGQLLTQYPNAKLVLANASGDYQAEIKALLAQIPAKNYVEIPFEADLANLYPTFDIFLHTPIDAVLEAFGQTYVEALAAGIPSIFTLSGVAPEFIKNQENALVVPYQNAEKIREAMVFLLEDQEIREKIISKGRKDVQNLFSLQKMIQILEKLYQED